MTSRHSGLDGSAKGMKELKKASVEVIVVKGLKGLLFVAGGRSKVKTFVVGGDRRCIV